MPRPDTDWVPCLRCQIGRNGDRSCGAGWDVRVLSSGCFLGRWLPGKEPRAAKPGVTVDASTRA